MKPRATRGLAIDYDFLSAMLGTGLPLYERRTTKPPFQVGDVLAVRETFRWIGYNRVECRVDAEDKSGYWEYANTMPLHVAKRFVRVVSIEKLTQEEYAQKVSGERAYNRTAFGMPLFTLPADRWFRDDLPVPDFDGEKWIVQYELYPTSHGPVQESGIINFYDYVRRYT